MQIYCCYFLLYLSVVYIVMSVPIPIPRSDSELSQSSSSEQELLLSTSPFDVAFNPTYKQWSDGSNWPIYSASVHSQTTINPIRRIVDVMTMTENPEKQPIKLHLGDPCAGGVLRPLTSTVNSLIASVSSGKYDGYGPAIGRQNVREAVANHFDLPEAPVTRDDVFITCGACQALELAIEALADTGDNILLPSPGFPLYATLMRPEGIVERYYHLIAENDWQIDLHHMKSLIDSKTKAIIINNPSNPCGAVFSKEHLSQILTIAYEHKLPIIADEIYAWITWSEHFENDHAFYPIATIEPKVPILQVDSISKRYLVPGWRLGWLIVHDRYGALRNIREGITHLSQKIMGACGIVQGSIPEILSNTPESHFANVIKVLSINARTIYDMLKDAPGLKPVKPFGSFYIFITLDMNKFPEFHGDEMEFCKRLIAEESVFVIPGTAFNYRKGAIRLTLTCSQKMTTEACNRIKLFCGRHYKQVVVI